MNMTMNINYPIIERSHRPMGENNLHFLVKFDINRFIDDCYAPRLITCPAQTVIIPADQDYSSMQCFN